MKNVESLCVRDCLDATLKADESSLCSLTSINLAQLVADSTRFGSMTLLSPNLRLFVILRIGKVNREKAINERLGKLTYFYTHSRADLRAEKTMTTSKRHRQENSQPKWNWAFRLIGIQKAPSRQLTSSQKQQQQQYLNKFVSID